MWVVHCPVLVANHNKLHLHVGFLVLFLRFHKALVIISLMTKIYFTSIPLLYLLSFLLYTTFRFNLESFYNLFEDILSSSLKSGSSNSTVERMIVWAAMTKFTMGRQWQLWHNFLWAESHGNRTLIKMYYNFIELKMWKTMCLMCCCWFFFFFLPFFLNHRLLKRWH